MQAEVQAEGRHKGNAEDPLKSLWAPKVPLVGFEGGAFEDIFTQPNLGLASLQVFIRWSPIFLMSFTSSSRKWLSRKLIKVRVLHASGTQGMHIQKAWFRFFSKA